jgi:hypothetical protein
MTDRPHLLAGLLARRKELVQEISATEALLRQRYSVLASLDHVIRLEDAKVELSPVPYSGKAERKPVPALPYGDIARFCLEALREASGEVLTTGQVVEYVMQKRELTFETQKQRKDFACSVATALSRAGRRGLVVKVGTAPNRHGLWAAKTG